MDTRYLISNSKDQSIKLWDMRRFADQSTINKSNKLANRINNNWDYRYGASESRRNNSLFLL
jgi:WD repeat-containing protein 23